jgi:exodeoxyribonuclease V gamma subunit
MFRLHTSNDAARLADALGEHLRTGHGNPLLPARVLVPQAGLRRWLQVHLAKRLGVLANVEFTPPAQFAWELLRAARPGLPLQSPFDMDVLRWHLYALLGERLAGHALAPLRDYLAADGDPLRRYALSFELARVYERMQGYRRDRLLAWERADAAGDWQAELWRQLLPRIGGVSRAARVDAWLQDFDPDYAGGEAVDKPAPPGLPERFACFACVNVSPDVLRMLAIAGLHCDVDFYLPLPSMEYLGDLPRTRAAVRARLGERNGENPLVISLGGALAGFVDMLFDYRHVQPDVEHDAYDPDIPRTTLLGRVRDDVLQHRLPPTDEPRPALPDDGSLQFHACHTPLREVQTLHDALLALLEAHPDMQPRDIAVMMPDVSAYRPAIEAVFGGIPRDDAQYLPYNLGDANAAALHPVVQLFLDLLDAPTSRWEANVILDALAAPGVMRRFDLDTDALERLGRRVRDAGVRWGEDEYARADCGGYREFSWAFGIDRLLAGFACGDADDTLVGGTAPLAGVEGAAFADANAALVVTHAWRQLREESGHPRSAAAWQALLNSVLDKLYQPDPRDLTETRALERIRGALAQLVHDCRATGNAPELPWLDLRAFLREQLANPDPAQYLFTGGVTFCGMVPLRVVPFRVICLLGMHESAFPRRETSGLDPLLADQRAGHPRRGDRDVRADDRLLFLQLLAAARDAFYVSWTGRDAHTNEALPPSVVVAELLDAVRDHYLQPPPDSDMQRQRDAWLPRVEPLHPFDPALFGGDAQPARSYHATWLPAARAPLRGAKGLPPFVTQALPAPRDQTDEVRLDELRRFFDNPARGFLEAALQLRLPRSVDEDADLEPLQPDAPLLRYGLTETLLANDAADALRQQALLRAQGALPPGELAEAAFAAASVRAAALQAAIVEFTGGTTQTGDIAASVNLDAGLCVSGSVAKVYSTGLVHASAASSLTGKRALRAWIDLLFATAALNQPIACRLFWYEKDAAKHRDLASVTPGEARVKLTALVAAMRAGQRSPLPLFPQASWDALKRARVQKGEAKADEFVANLTAQTDPDADRAPGADFLRPEVLMAWRGVDFGALDAHAANAFYTTARALLPTLQAGKPRT